MLVFIVEKPSAKRLGDETLRGEVVTLVELMTTDDVEDAGITFEARGMKLNAIKQVGNAREAALRIFQRHPPDETVHLVTQCEQVLGQVAPVLTGDACNQCLPAHSSSPIKLGKVFREPLILLTRT